MNGDKPFRDKVVLITGGGSGIGRSTALAFARAGAAVAVAGRRPRPLEETVRLIQETGAVGLAVPADITRREDAARMVDTVVGVLGGLHIAVNNAGILGRPGLVGEVDDSNWAEVMAVNLTGTWLAMQYQIAHMMQQGGGAIINVASSVGPHMAVPGLGPYGAAKAAVVTLTKTAAKEYARHGIRINAVSPGPVATSMNLLPGESEEDRDARMGAPVPIGRIGRPEEVAEAILWLAGPGAAFTVGHDLVVDGGSVL